MARESISWTALPHGIRGTGANRVILVSVFASRASIRLERVARWNRPRFRNSPTGPPVSRQPAAAGSGSSSARARPERRSLPVSTKRYPPT